MTDHILLEYRINRHADKFVAIDSTNEVLGIFDTEREAIRDVERALLDDAMYKHSKILFHAAIASVMDSFGVYRGDGTVLGSDSGGAGVA